VMPLDRMPSISLGIIVRVGVVYDASYHWRTDAGELRASVGFDAGGHSNAHIQGSPAALRELAAALIQVATGPKAPRTLPMPWPWWRGWPSDVGRQPRLPGLCVGLAYPLPLARAGRRRRWGAG
jgi:hypothetical protein